MKLLKSKTTILLIVLAVFAVAHFEFNARKAEAQDIGSVTSDLLKTLSGDSGGGDVIKIVSDTSTTAVTTALQNTLARVFDGISSQQLESMNLKEMVLDPIAWNMGKELQKQMTGELLKWVGGQLPGQNGEVPFVQNYTQNEKDIFNSVMGEYLSEGGGGGGLAGICNPEDSFDARTAILNSTLADVRRAEGGSSLSCQSQQSATDDLRGYSSLAHKIMGDFLECRDETCAYFEGRTDSYLRVQNAQESEKEIREYSRGMKPQRVCRDVNDIDGKPKQVCEIVNPLFLASDNLSFQLTEVPSLQLLEMDEFSEIVSSFMTQLTNEAVTGISSLANNVDFTGVLGMSGNPDYTNLLFGSDGGLSYVDSLIKEQPPKNQGGNTNNPIYESLVTELENLSMQTFIFNEVSALKKKTEDNKLLYGTCYDLELTTELTKALSDATANIQISSTSVAILNTLNEQYTKAANSSVANSVMSTYITYRNQGIFKTKQQNLELKTTFIDYTFKTMVEQFKYAISSEQQSCGGDFDYEGVPGQERDRTSGSGV